MILLRCQADENLKWLQIANEKLHRIEGRNSAMHFGIFIISCTATCTPKTQIANTGIIV
jgi:hypothetical protein